MEVVDDIVLEFVVTDYCIKIFLMCLCNRKWCYVFICVPCVIIYMHACGWLLRFQNTHILYITSTEMNCAVSVHFVSQRSFW